MQALGRVLLEETGSTVGLVAMGEEEDMVVDTVVDMVSLL